MGETEAEVGRGARRDLRHDRHTVSLLTDHLVFSPKYRGTVLLGEVAEAAEEIVIDEEKKKEKALKTDTLLFIPNFFTLTGSGDEKI